MKFTFSFKIFMLGMTILLSFSACNGILGGIYDKPTEEKEFGFIEIDEENRSGRIYIDATSYERWTFINFHDFTTDTINVFKDMPEPDEWDIAIHRYDAKTNGATVLETVYTELDAVKSSGKIPEGLYVEDEWTTDKIMIDVSGMMAGNILYEESYFNTELTKWLFVDTTNMPPSYYPSNKVYVIKLKDNTVAAVRLKNYMNASGTKGYMTIDYIYPLEF